MSVITVAPAFWLPTLLATLWALLGVSTAQAQTAPPSSAPAAETTNSSVVPRASGRSSGQGFLSLAAILSEEGEPVGQGLNWYIFRAEARADGKRTLVQRSNDPTPQITLDAGDYYVTATFGRATLTHHVTIGEGQQVTEKFDLEAGGLRVKAVLPTGEPAPDRSVVFDVLNEDRDQSGNRVKVISAARPGPIVRLSAGVYQVVSTYGDANARVRAEVTVLAGKLTEVTLAQTGAKITFKLVDHEGGEALADVAWSIINAKAETVKETAGAVPTHILAAGRYAVLARHLGRTFRVEFTAKPGDATIVEVVAR